MKVRLYYLYSLDEEAEDPSSYINYLIPQRQNRLQLGLIPTQKYFRRKSSQALSIFPTFGRPKQEKLLWVWCQPGLQSETLRKHIIKPSSGCNERWTGGLVWVAFSWFVCDLLFKNCRMERVGGRYGALSFDVGQGCCLRSLHIVEVCEVIRAEIFL